MAEIKNLKIGNGGTLHIVGNEDIVANAWQAGKTYVKNKSYVIREHSLYVCNVTHTSVEPFDTTKWTEITIGDAIGNNIGDLSQLTTTDKSSLVGAVNELDSDLSNLPTEIRCGIGNYSGLKGGGHPNRVNVPITFSTPMTGTQYSVFIVIADAYSDYPYVQGYCFSGSRTANGFTATILSMSSHTTTEISGSFYWVAVRYK